MSSKIVLVAIALLFQCQLFVSAEIEWVDIEDQEVSLKNNSYLEIPGLIPHNSTSELSIVLYLKTQSTEGSIFWQGQNKTTNGTNGDFIAIGIQNKTIEFKYKCGSIENTLRGTDFEVSDGNLHVIRFEKRARKQKVRWELGGDEYDSAPLDCRFNINGNIFLGGTPDTIQNPYNQSFDGCITSVALQRGNTLNLRKLTISSKNAELPCPRKPYRD